MTRKMAGAVVALALVGACAEPGTMQVGGDEASPGTSASGLAVDLRLRAIGTEQYSSLQLLANRVLVSADGIPVAVQDMNYDPVELTQMEHAAKVASFRVPEGAKQVEFTVELAPAGGYEKAGERGWVDSRSTTLRFTTPVANLAQKNKAVVELNAEKSLVPREAGRIVLVPKYRIEY